MTAVKVLALVLGSVWFFPVSCTSILYAGTHIIARFDAREVARGDQIHPTFSIVVEPGDKDQPFRSVPLSEFPGLRESGKAYSLLMSKPSARIDTGDYTYLSYRVLQNQGSAQVIEVEDKDSDRTAWSRYRATNTDIAPLASRLFYFGYMFGALPYALGTAVVLYGLGRFLRRKLRVVDGAAKAS